ncbi:uncharacterized protein LOC126553869 [Aphis gossypii]|uniref:uncharacterized protein LOC126553869 n=1 Tax=Aphis gossypii TaxID=80765 RepID=UPI002158C5A5|nr:uncharacterized protein LOC126553869 [Aphis gossypii]
MGTRIKQLFSQNQSLRIFEITFGLSSQRLQRTTAMKVILMGLEELCTAYLDDIVVHGSSLRDHQNKLEQVFTRLRSHKLKLQPAKCAILLKEVVYLGHLISENGVTSDPNKLSCIKDYPRPLTEKDVKSFLGLLNYYRRFVDNFAKIAKPLTNLLKKNTPFVWTDMCEDAFQELKKSINEPTSVSIPHPNWENGNFNLMMDASQYAIGAVLSQGKAPKDQPVIMQVGR